MPRPPLDNKPFQCISFPDALARNLHPIAAKSFKYDFVANKNLQHMTGFISPNPELIRR